MFKTCEELRAKIAECTEALDGKFNGADGKRYIMSAAAPAAWPQAATR